MFHPLIRLLVSQPELVAEHLGGYVQLAGVEVGDAARALYRHAALKVAAAVCAGLGVGLAGVAGLLAAALPLDGMPAPWALLVVPALPLAAALVCGWAAGRIPVACELPQLRAQWATDAALLRQVEEPS